MGTESPYTWESASRLCRKSQGGLQQAAFRLLRQALHQASGRAGPDALVNASRGDAEGAAPGGVASDTGDLPGGVASSTNNREDMGSSPNCNGSQPVGRRSLRLAAKAGH